MSEYILDPRFADEPEHYMRALVLIQKDLHEIFEYVEPADKNRACYSYRIHALLMRTCIEIEANCKAILAANDYRKSRPKSHLKSDYKSDSWDMSDYRKLDETHRLSGYQIKLPVWKGTRHTRTPFAMWKTGKKLDWYTAYNDAKHDRHNKFPNANFDNLLDAICGLVAILSSQFHTQDFSGSRPGLALVSGGGPPEGFETAIGDYFWVKFPMDWPEADQYDFNWPSIKDNPDPFDKLSFGSP